MREVYKTTFVLTFSICIAVNTAAFMNSAPQLPFRSQSNTCTDRIRSSSTTQTLTAFGSHLLVLPTTKPRPFSLLKSSKSNNDSNNKSPSLSSSSSSSSSSRTTSLHFKGQKVYKSEPVAILHDTSSDDKNNNNDDNGILSFFQDEEVRSILLNGDRENSIELIKKENINQAMIDLWMQQAEVVGGDVPSMSNGDVVFQVNTGTMNFSGLKISSNSLIGVKYLNTNEKEQPEYQLVFIKDKPVVGGPRILVWIYNRLTGNGKSGKKKTKNGQTDDDDNDDNDGKEQSVNAFSRFTYETTPDGKSIVFSVESTLEVIVKFPSLLLKVIPVSKEKAEEQGSASVLKAMGKDIEAVLPKVRSHYVKMFEKKVTTTTTTTV